jgi:hypothetical protein
LRLPVSYAAGIAAASLAATYGDNLLRLCHCKSENAAAAPFSRIVATFTPQWWLLPYLLPLAVAQKSPIGGTPRASRRVIRQQTGEFRQSRHKLIFSHLELVDPRHALW